MDTVLVDLFQDLNKYSGGYQYINEFEQDCSHRESNDHDLDINSLKEVLHKIYSHNAKSKNYWELCDLQTYIDNYERLKGEYKDYFIDAAEKDFIYSEVERIQSITGDYADFGDTPMLRLSNFSDWDYDFFALEYLLSVDDCLKPIELSQLKKIEFLKGKLTDAPTYVSEEVEPIEIDLDKITEKVLLLFELGIVDHLKTRYHVALGDNINYLSKIIANFNGANPSTVQKIVNALIKDNPTDRSYPKASQKVKMIIDKLDINNL